MNGLLNSITKNDSVRRVAHTFWEAFLAVFLAGAFQVISKLLSMHSFSDAKSALLALVVAALAAGFSAIKGLVTA